MNAADVPGIRPQLSARIADQVTDRAVRELREGQRAAAERPVAQVIADVELENGVETPIQHGLAQAPQWVSTSPPRGAASTGRIEEVRSAAYDRGQVVVLKATGWGATIAVDIEVY